ncbi:MAG: hypothetical protein OHK0029_33760 [Armatimonadaceae bacterium]
MRLFQYCGILFSIVTCLFALVGCSNEPEEAAPPAAGTPAGQTAPQQGQMSDNAPVAAEGERAAPQVPSFRR